MSELLRVFCVWRERSASRWVALLGDDAGDLLQELYLRLERAQGFVYHSDQATMRYIEQVASYTIREMRRTQARRREVFGVALELGARGLTASGECQVGQERVELNVLIDLAGLSLRQRVVVKSRQEGLDTSQIAGLLGVKEDAVRQLESEAVRRLRQSAQSDGGGA